MRSLKCDIGSAGSLLGIVIACALLVAVGMAKAESGARRDCLDQAKEGSAIEYRQNPDTCRPPKPAGQGKPTPRDSKERPSPGIAVDDLLALVKNFNPELAAAALDREAAAAKIYPAGALDDPMVNLSRDQGFRQTLLTVSQDFPLWGKRELRREVAERTRTLRGAGRVALPASSRNR